jgi:hypothetical protein
MPAAPKKVSRPQPKFRKFPEMKIPSLDALPELANASEWAHTLGTFPSTMSRAYKSGKLRGSTVGRRTVLFTRADILDWLGFEIVVEPLPPVPQPPPVMRIVAKPIVPHGTTPR